MLFTMISYYFSSITRHRFPRICEVFVRKDFSRFFDVLWKFYSEKTITESKCLFGCHDDRMTCAVQHRQWRYVNRLALHLEVSKKFLWGTLNFLRETQNVFRDTNNFLRETQHVFRDTTNFLRETRGVFRDTETLVDSVKCCHAYSTKTVPSYEYMITNCDVVNGDECVSRAHMLCKCKQKDSRSRLHLQKSGCRIRDREPSRVSLRKVIRKTRKEEQKNAEKRSSSFF